jgi:putative ABC transport system substrate-binding protein
MNKKLLVVIVVIVAAFVGLFLFGPKKRGGEDIKKIGVVFLLRHPAIDQGLDGFKAELARLQTSSDRRIEAEYVNAFGEPKNVHTIVGTFKDKNYDAVVALTTPCAQIAKQLVKERPVIFVGVSDPIGAGLVASLDHGTENVTGTMSKDPVFENLRLAVRLFPKLRRIGVLFNSVEANSRSIIQSLNDQIAASNLPIILDTAAVSQTTELLAAGEKLVAETDALFLINDNLVVSSADLLIRLAQKAGKPIFASDTDSVKKGALFAYGLDYRDEGVAAAKMVVELLDGEKQPREIPVFVNTQYYLHANSRLTKDFRVDPALIQGAKIVDSNSGEV